MLTWIRNYVGGSLLTDASLPNYSGMHIALGDNAYGTMIGNLRNFHDHLKDVAEADDLLKLTCIFSP